MSWQGQVSAPGARPALGVDTLGSWKEGKKVTGPQEAFFKAT